jgi:hypothetical protein
MSKEERLALVKEGREDRGKYQARAAVKQKKVIHFVFLNFCCWGHLDACILDPGVGLAINSLIFIRSLA